MATGWLSQQIKAAEDLLNAVDRGVMKTVSQMAPGAEAGEHNPPGQGARSQDADAAAPEDQRLEKLASSIGARDARDLLPTAPGAALRGSSAQLPNPPPPSSVPALSRAAQHPGREAAAPPGTAATAARLAAANLPTLQFKEDTPPRVDATSAQTVLQRPGPAQALHQADDEGTSSISLQQPTVTHPASPLPLPASMAATSVKQSSPGDELVTGAPVLSTESSQPTGPTPQLALEQQVTKLRDRLKARQVEVEQLEDLLARAETRCEQVTAQAAQLGAQASALSEAKAAAEASLTSQLAQQASALREATSRADALSHTVAQLQLQLAAAQENSRSMLQGKADLDAEQLQALRGELAHTEAALDAERRAHAATRGTAAGREAELEAALADNATALAQAQQRAEDGAARIRELEDDLAMATSRALEQARAMQRNAVADPGAGALPPSILALQQEVEQLRMELADVSRDLRVAESGRLAAQAETATLRTELGTLAAEGQQMAAWHQEAAAMEGSLAEARELLVQKSATIEALRADRAALQMRLERQLDMGLAVRTADHQAVTVMAPDAAAAQRWTSAEAGIVPMGSVLGERYRRLASRQDGLGAALVAAANLVDKTASRASHLLRQYPLARIGVLIYLFALHAYVYFLTLRLQHAAVMALDARRGVP